LNTKSQSTGIAKIFTGGEITLEGLRNKLLRSSQSFLLSFMSKYCQQDWC